MFTNMLISKCDQPHWSWRIRADIFVHQWGFKKALVSIATVPFSLELQYWGTQIPFHSAEFAPLGLHLASELEESSADAGLALWLWTVAHTRLSRNQPPCGHNGKPAGDTETHSTTRLFCNLPCPSNLKLDFRDTHKDSWALGSSKFHTHL